MSPRLAGGSGPVAVTTHNEATTVALDVMGQGGNAADAAIAANAVIGVMLPDTCGVGGDLFALVHRNGETAPLCLNASGRAGSGADAAALRDQGLDEIPMMSHLGITVPGCVDGWEALLERCGSSDLARLLQPAISRASDGFEVSPEFSRSLGRSKDWIGSQPSAAALYPGGEAPASGQTISRPDLAVTLDALAAGGRSAFFDHVGGQIIEATQGLITAPDLARSQADWVEPLGTEVLGRTGWTVPPNSQGYLTLATTWLFEDGSPPRDPSDPMYQWQLISAYRSIAQEHGDVVADPDTAPLAAKDLLSPERLRRVAAGSGTGPPQGAGGTTYLCTMDGDGMAVSLIQSNYTGIGSGLSAGDTGVFLHNRGAGFNLRPDHPNELMPGRRPLHTLSPTMWTDDGHTDLVLGTRGGLYQPQLLAQMAAHLYHAGLDPAAAHDQPRWVMDQWEAGTSVRIQLEDAGGSIAESLQELGCEVELVPASQEGWGPVSLIQVDGSGARTGAADPRVSTAAAGAL